MSSQSQKSSESLCENGDGGDVIEKQASDNLQLFSITQSNEERIFRAKKVKDSGAPLRHLGPLPVLVTVGKIVQLRLQPIEPDAMQDGAKDTQSRNKVIQVSDTGTVSPPALKGQEGTRLWVPSTTFYRLL